MTYLLLSAFNAKLAYPAPVFALVKHQEITTISPDKLVVICTEPKRWRVMWYHFIVH
jgi:hypothetical protein